MYEMSGLVFTLMYVNEFVDQFQVCRVQVRNLRVLSRWITEWGVWVCREVNRAAISEIVLLEQEHDVF